jgi:hypothetical protein
MSSIFPDTAAGGLPIRNPDGSTIDNPNVVNEYVPKPAYVSTCTLTALPSTCDARIEPKQINAIVSEMLALAECWDANGPWDCTKLTNLCIAFNTWKASLNITTFIHVSDTPPASPQAKQLWFESDTGNLYIYYADANSNQWVMVAGPISNKPVMDGVSIVGGGTQADPHKVGLVDCGSY